MTDEKVPDLEFNGPDCTYCPSGGAVAGDGDSWWCAFCGSTWDYDGTNGERSES